MNGDDATAAASPRGALEAEHAHLRAQLEEIADGETGLDDNFADSGQVAAEQGESRTIAATLREQLDDVDRALAKLEDGTYGRCEVCGEEISADRLEAMPAARYCIQHAG